MTTETLLSSMFIFCYAYILRKSPLGLYKDLNTQKRTEEEFTDNSGFFGGREGSVCFLAREDLEFLICPSIILPVLPNKFPLVFPIIHV